MKKKIIAVGQSQKVLAFCEDKVVSVGTKVQIVRGKRLIANAIVSQALPKLRQVVLDHPVTAKPGDTIVWITAP